MEDLDKGKWYPDITDYNDSDTKKSEKTDEDDILQKRMPMDLRK